MKRRQKLYLFTIVFLILTVFAMLFVLSNPDRNEIEKQSVYQSNAEQKNSSHKNMNNNNGQNSKNKEEASNNRQIEKIDWQPILDKWKGKEISKIKTEKKIIALTFDAGGNTDGLEKILEVLEKENVKGTFFLTGKFIAKYPEETKKIIKSSSLILQRIKNDIVKLISHQKTLPRQ